MDMKRSDLGDLVMEPGMAGYEEVSGTALVAGSPAYVLQPRTVSEVQRAVRFAAGTGLGLAVRGGGHSFAGFGTNAGGVVIDLSGLNGVMVVDKARHLVRIGGGATWGEVVDALGPEGLAISAGDTRGVGVGGLTLGGGIGWKVRKYGLALDQLEAVELVTAAGEVVRASATENAELFWAVRGGGGNFGIVTAFDFVAHPTSKVFYGTIGFAGAEAAAVLRGWAEVMREAPEELTSVVEFANPFAGPNGPVRVQVAFDGDDAVAAAQAIDPIRRLGTVLSDDVAAKPYAETLVEAMSPPPGILLSVRSGFVDAPAVSEVLDILSELRAAPGAPVIGVRSVGGAVSRVAGDATAYAHRQAELLFFTTAIGPAPAIEAGRPALDAVWNRLAPHVAGAYGNFTTAATTADVATIYPAATLERLAAVKRQYDPGNLFAGNHNVASR